MKFLYFSFLWFLAHLCRTKKRVPFNLIRNAQKVKLRPRGALFHHFVGYCLAVGQREAADADPALGLLQLAAVGCEVFNVANL